MPKYQYTALDHKGDQKTGSLEANSEAEAMEAIRAHGLYPTQIVEAGKGKIQQTPAAKKKAKGAKKQKRQTGRQNQGQGSDDFHPPACYSD